MEVIRVENLSRVFKVPKKEEGIKGSVKSLFHRSYEEKTAVDNISFSISKGDFVGFIGPNGAGKTTAIKMLSGIIYPSSGSVKKKHLHTGRTLKRAQWCSFQASSRHLRCCEAASFRLSVKVLGYVPQKMESGFKRRFSVVMGQKNQLWWDIPAADSFLLFKEIYQIPQQQFKRNVSELSELLEVEGLLNTPVRNLSLGERMKMELIATILHEPEVIFLDEPTIGLDVFSRRKIRDFLKHINKEKQVTILLTSHYIEDIKALCSRIIAIQQGKIVYDGPFEAISKELVDSKQITVSYENNALIEKLQRFAQILERSGNRATFLVKRKSIREFCEQLTSDEDFYDMNIEDVPVDEIFEKLFHREEGLVI